jgi:phosphate transport system permease protein
MDRLAFIGILFFSLLIAFNGSLRTPAIFARKGYSPTRGALAGLITGFVGSVVLGLLFSLVGNAGLAVLGSLIGGIGALAILWNQTPDHAQQGNTLPEGENLLRNIRARHLKGRIMKTLFQLAIAVALISLATLLWTVINKTIGFTAVQYAIEPEELTIHGEPTGRPLDDLSQDELAGALADNMRINRLLTLLLEDVAKSTVSGSELRGKTVSQLLHGHTYPPELADTPFTQLTPEQAATILAQNQNRSQLRDLVYNEIVQPEVVHSWTLWESITQRDEVHALKDRKYPKAHIEWHSWLNWHFISSPLDPRRADTTGLRPALIGSLLVIAFTIFIAFPVGIGAAIYLEEYAKNNWFNRVIQTNINNLAGVPSIIYGMLGLAIFVRSLDNFTSGNAFGVAGANGRTVASAGFTLALLILPLIIINAQEAIRAVPNSLRQASYGLGATKWQTIWHHVLPNALPGIMTGTILAISRALGETAPLIMIGASTYITQDPTGPFSKFTALPMMVYRWTSLPQAEFRNAAAAAIVVLLIVLLTLNSTAVLLRNRFTRRLS